MTETLSSSCDTHSAADTDSDFDRASLTTSLFDRMADCTDPHEIQGLREQIISINMKVAESLSRRYYGHGENHDDLRQVAYLGLTKAVAGFDPTRGRDFLSYAVPTITGELKKHFRDHCWTVRPPRRIQDLQREITAVREQLSHDNRRQPTARDVAEELGISIDEVAEAMAAQGCFSPTSLDARVRSESTMILSDQIPGDDRELRRSEARLLLAPIMSSLPTVDREILALRFYEEWTQEQIAGRFGTSQMQISRHLSRLMKQLRAVLEPETRCA